MTRRSIRARLFLASVLAVAVVLLAAAGGLALLFDRHVERVAVADLDARSRSLAASIEPGEDGRPVIAVRFADPLYERPFSGHYWTVAMADEEARSRSLWDYGLPPPAAAEPGSVTVRTVTGPQGEPLLALDRTVLVGANGAPVRITVATSKAELAAARAAFLRDLTPYLLLLGALLVLAWSVQVVVGLRPLSAIGTRVADLASGRLKRLGSDLPREVMPLAAEIDALLDARDADVERARVRASDLAHGLKTPLQALAGEAARLREHGEAEAADSIEVVAAAMTRHVERELSRARLASAGGNVIADPRTIADKVVAVLKRTPKGADTVWEVTGPPGIAARIDPGDLTEALGALGENALRHARSRVGVRVETRPDGWVAVEVSDDGPGVPPEDLRRLTLRGHRLDEANDGQGLGLAIVAAVAEAAEGRLELTNRVPGLQATLMVRGHRR